MAYSMYRAMGFIKISGPRIWGFREFPRKRIRAAASMGSCTRAIV